MAANPEMQSSLNEGELMRACAPLYESFALESVSGILLVAFFSYILLVLHSVGELKSPGKAVCRWLASCITSYFSQFWAFASVWCTVRSMPLSARLRWCRKCNTFVCSFTIIASVISITRMLHINNINGMKYLGYAVTCPIMMVELVVLIGPVVPLYHITMVLTWTMTLLCLVAGYMASLQEGRVWEGDIFNDFDLSSQTLKFWFTVSSVGCFAVLLVIILYLALIYYIGKCRYGSTGLPWQYIHLLGIVVATWVLFPAWWFFSYEGMNILTDTRLNALGFAVLNMTSKGLFTWQMLRIARHEKQRAQEASQYDDADKTSEVPSSTSGSSNSTHLWLMGSDVATEKSLMVSILAPFDAVETPKVPKQRSRRDSRDMSDIPGSFKLGEQRIDLESGNSVLPVLKQKPSSRSSSKERVWNPTLPSLTENRNSPGSQETGHMAQILEQLTVFNARLASLEQGNFTDPKKAPKEFKSEEIITGGGNVPDERLTFSERPTFCSETSDPEWEKQTFSSERPTFSSETSDLEQEKRACGGVFLDARPSFSSERPTFESEPNETNLMSRDGVPGEGSEWQLEPEDLLSESDTNVPVARRTMI